MVRRVAEILLESAERFGDREALRDPNGQVTYGELTEDALRIAGGLVGLGVEQGDRCIVLLDNSVDFVRAHFGVMLAGAVSVPCDAMAPAERIAMLARDSESRVLLTSARQLSRVGDGLTDLSLIGTVLLGPDAEGAGVGTPVGQLPSGAAPRLGDPGGLASIMYTTGSTGEPKGVMLTHDNVMAALTNICGFVGYTPEDREVVILPLSHNFGLGHVYCNLMSGGAVYTEPGLKRVGRVLKALASFEATGFPGTPLGFGMLLDRYASVLATRGKTLRFIVINSAPMPPHRTEQLQEVLPDVDIMVYYGLTEASRSCFASLTRMGPSRYRSVGPPMASVRLRLVDGDGREVKQGEEGEVLIGGPTVTGGYWKRPEETAATLKEGWLLTGDIGVQDPDGALTVTGRLKDQINVGGLKFHPREVEDVLKTFPGVAEVGVVGVSDWGPDERELVVAAVVLEDAEAEVDATACERHCLDSLERYMVPERFVKVSAIPRTDTGKLKRHELTRLVRDRLEEEAQC